MKIKVMVKIGGKLPEIISVGDWIDLSLAEDIVLRGPYSKALRKKTREGEVMERYRNVVFDSCIARLGVCMELPDGFEAVIVPRSSTFKKYGILQTNHMSVIDNNYKSDKDEWQLPILATRAINIPRGERIAQFRIQLSQKATFWQKLRWLFSSHIEIEQVTSLNNPPRGGFGTTNKAEV